MRRSRFTQKQVQEIKRFAKRNTQAKTAKKFGISQPMVSMIVRKGANLYAKRKTKGERAVNDMLAHLGVRITALLKRVEAVEAIVHRKANP